MKRLIQICAMATICTGAFAQNEMMHLPNGTTGISSSTNSRGVAIGPGFDTPAARLHIRDEGLSGTDLMIDMENQLIGGTGGTNYLSPDYFIQARFKDNELSPSSYIGQFSVDKAGKIQAGFVNPAVTDQLAVRNDFGIYASINRTLRFDLKNSAARMIWESPNDNFQFVNGDNASVALELGELGEVGVNTGTFTSNHKLHVEGGALSDYSVVQPTSDWGSSEEFVGLYFTDRPEMRWESGSTDYFEFKAADTGEVPLRLSSAGKVGINTDCISGTHSLFIEGSAIAEEIFVQLKSTWCDYVFEDDYYLRPLAEVEDYIKDNGHLPNIPSAAEIEETGIPLGEMERLLTEKVEELTLYIIQMQKEIDTLKKEIKD